MAAFNEPGPPRKRIATYGKAVRKWPPDRINFNSLHDFERSQPASKPASKLARPPSAREDVSAGVSPPPLSKSSAAVDMFDIPSSDDEVRGMPKKKRKLPQSARSSKATLIEDVIETDSVFQQHALNPADEGSSFEFQALDQTIEPESHPRRTSKMEETTHLRPGNSKSPALLNLSEGGSVPASQSSRHISMNTLRSLDKMAQKTRSPSTYLKGNTSKSTSSRAPQSSESISTTPTRATISAAGKPSGTPVTPTVLPSRKQNVETLQSTPTILTPKGMKMWDDLLGGDSDDELQVKYSKNASKNELHDKKRGQSTALHPKLPRRRLIDSLFDQYNDKRFMLDLEYDPEELVSVETNLSRHGQTIKNQEPSPCNPPSVQTSPERIGKPNKATGGGQISLPFGPKITYSRQRSMLIEQDLAKEMTFDMPLLEELPSKGLKSQRNSSSVLNPQHSFHERREAQGEQSGVAIRTMHELRQAGAESRFKDEVEDLLDRIGTPAQQVSVRRSGLMDLAVRMRDKTFHAKFLSNGIDQQLFLHLGQEKDIVAGFIMISLLIAVLDSGITAAAVAQLHQQGVARLLDLLIGIDESIPAIIKARKIKISKSAQAMLTEQYETLRLSRVWDIQPQSISPRTASLRCLELMARQSRETKDTGGIISEELVSRLFSILEEFSKNRSQGREGIDFPLILSTLEFHSLDPKMDLDKYLPIIREVLEITLHDDLASEGPNVARLLRIVLNTTSKSSTASDAFASPFLLHLMSRAVIEKFKHLSGPVSSDERLALVDRLILILIAMINIVESSRRAGQCLLLLEDTSLEDLTLIFEENTEKALEAESVEETLFNVAGGYLAVLLGYLSLHPAIEERIVLRQRTQILQPLINCIDEFISHHKKVDDLYKEEAGLTGRLQSLVERLKSGRDN